MRLVNRQRVHLPATGSQGFEYLLFVIDIATALNIVGAADWSRQHSGRLTIALLKICATIYLMAGFSLADVERLGIGNRRSSTTIQGV
jgi:hypothetical protein